MFPAKHVFFTTRERGQLQCRDESSMFQGARFLLGRFRLDVWWYGVPLLLRGGGV